MFQILECGLKVNICIFYSRETDYIRLKGRIEEHGFQVSGLKTVKTVLCNEQCTATCLIYGIQK